MYNNYMKGRYVGSRSIMTTEEGIRMLQPGDVVADEDDPDTKATPVPGRIPEDTSGVWAAGRPLHVVANDKKFIVSRMRARDKVLDMDAAIPREILARRKKLVMDRYKQERTR